MSYDGKPWVDVRGYGNDVIAILIENAPTFSTQRPGNEVDRYFAVEMDVERAKRVRDELTRRIDMIEKG